ncbi:GNAT family N-acetyltransferase [Pseudalkalibacillus sp. R45]|uniref:GNAT family N-acetyltransferase n=1 Tax=Pseudalkalibacillus sp. R45 TaxID=3457433 RepID=UPI003FCC32A4
MEQLEKRDYIKAVKILEKEQTDHTFSYSVLEGIVDGRVFVDDRSAPKAVLIEVHNGIHHLVGNSEDGKFDEVLHNWFMEKVINKNKPMVLFASKEWEDQIDHWNVASDKKSRIVYALNKEKFYEQEKLILPKGYTVKKVDSAIIGRSEEYTEKFYELYWGSLDNFFSHGFGFCIVNGQADIVCEATTVAVGGGSFDFDLYTSEAYRRNGFGGIIGQMMIDDGLKQHLSPRWECFDSNISSIKTAESLGFDQVCTHPFYIL